MSKDCKQAKFFGATRLRMLWTVILVLLLKFTGVESVRIPSEIQYLNGTYTRRDDWVFNSTEMTRESLGRVWNGYPMRFSCTTLNRKEPLWVVIRTKCGDINGYADSRTKSRRGYFYGFSRQHGDYTSRIFGNFPIKEGCTFVMRVKTRGGRAMCTIETESYTLPHATGREHNGHPYHIYGYEDCDGELVKGMERSATSKSYHNLFHARFKRSSTTWRDASLCSRKVGNHGLAITEVEAKHIPSCQEYRAAMDLEVDVRLFGGLIAIVKQAISVYEEAEPFVELMNIMRTGVEAFVAVPSLEAAATLCAATFATTFVTGIVAASLDNYEGKVNGGFVAAAGAAGGVVGYMSGKLKKVEDAVEEEGNYNLYTESFDGRNVATTGISALIGVACGAGGSAASYGVYNWVEGMVVGTRDDPDATYDLPPHSRDLGGDGTYTDVHLTNDEYVASTRIRQAGNEVHPLDWSD